MRIQSNINNIPIVKEHVYEKCLFKFTNLLFEKESEEYEACSFKLNNFYIIGRTAKITPTKIGQFVTFWKRIKNGPIQPFHISDKIDFFVVNVRKDNYFGQFVFPKSVLLKQGVISSDLKEGKREIRVYPPWDITTSKQAQKTQIWQLNYFLPIDINKPIDINRAKNLFEKFL